MKKSLFVALLIVAGVVLFAACGSAQKAGGETKGGGSSSVSGNRASDLLEMIEDKGTSMGVSQPAWVAAAVQEDFPTLKKDSRFEGKTPFVFNGQGADLDLTQSWVNNFIAGGAIARQISTQVNAKFEGGLQGTNNTGKLQKLKEIVATLSRSEINGMAREMDWWRLNRRKDTGAETYTYFVVYSISTDNLNYQIAQAMGKIAAKNAEEKELLDDMNTALKELEFGGIIPAPESR